MEIMLENESKMIDFINKKMLKTASLKNRFIYPNKNKKISAQRADKIIFSIISGILYFAETKFLSFI